MNHPNQPERSVPLRLLDFNKNTMKQHTTKNLFGLLAAATAITAAIPRPT